VEYVIHHHKAQHQQQLKAVKNCPAGARKGGCVMIIIS
jgi:hypothetical protein